MVEGDFPQSNMEGSGRCSPELHHWRGEARESTRGKYCPRTVPGEGNQGGGGGVKGRAGATEICKCSSGAAHWAHD